MEKLIGKWQDFSKPYLSVQMDPLVELEHAFEKVTDETCKKIIRKVQDVQDIFWREDEKLEKNFSL